MKRNAKLLNSSIMNDVSSSNQLENELVPPVTPGIGQQPTAEELSAIAAEHAANARFVSWRTKVLIIGAIVSVVGVVLGITVLQRSTASPREEVGIQIPEPEIIEVSEASSEAQAERRMLSDVIFSGDFLELFADSVTTTLFDLQWRDRGLEFELLGVHSLGILQDSMYASVEISEKYSQATTVVAEVSVYDSRETGPQIPIQAHTYLATRYELTDGTPVEWREKMSVPGQETTVFIPFTLPSSQSEFLILVGDLRNPSVASVSAQPQAAAP